MAIIVKDKYCCKCGSCEKMLFLPGVVPDEKTLMDIRWKYCPYCGEEIEYTGGRFDGKRDTEPHGRR